MPVHTELSREMLLFHHLYHQKIARRFRALHMEELSQVEYLLLSIVLAYEPVTVKELVSRSMMLKQQVALNLRRLEEMGYIERRHAEGDRRSVVVSATDEARALQRRLIRDAQTELSELFDKLEEKDANAYLESLRTINGILDKMQVGK